MGLITISRWDEFYLIHRRGAATMCDAVHADRKLKRTFYESDAKHISKIQRS